MIIVTVMIPYAVTYPFIFFHEYYHTVQLDGVGVSGYYVRYNFSNPLNPSAVTWYPVPEDGAVAQKIVDEARDWDLLSFFIVTMSVLSLEIYTNYWLLEKKRG